MYLEIGGYQKRVVSQRIECDGCRSEGVCGEPLEGPDSEGGLLVRRLADRLLGQVQEQHSLAFWGTGQEWWVTMAETPVTTRP